MFKVLLRSKAKQTICIDSDDPNELDQLSNVAKVKERKMRRTVVYSTRNTLTQPWCTDEIINVIGATKAKGLAGVVARWGYTSLSRMTHRGLRTVACIGAWRPARVQFHLPRSGPNGFHLQRRAMRVILSESSEV